MKGKGIHVGVWGRYYTSEITQKLELADNDFKAVVINIFMNLKKILT